MVSRLLAAGLVAVLVAACTAQDDGDGADSSEPVAYTPKGFTDDTIKIGLATLDASAARNYFESADSNIETADEQAVAKAVVEYINANGGMAGRQVEPVFALDGVEDLTSTNMQADCSTFTEDNVVFAAFSTAISVSQVGQLADCLVDEQTFFVFNSRVTWDREDFDRWSPFVYMPNYLSGDRYEFIVDELDRIGYFTPDAKVGLINIEEPGAERLLDDVVRPKLDELGVEVAEVASTPSFNSIEEVGNITAQVKNLVVQFKDAGITHVMFVGTYSTASYYFPGEAAKQGYFPTYAFNSGEAPQGLNADLPPEALSGSVGIGWVPGLDVLTPEDPGDNAAATTCLEDILAAAGLTAPARTAEYLALNICDGLLFMKAALDGAEDLTPEAIEASVKALGTSYQSALTFRTDFSDGRIDGAAGFRALAHDDGCKCFVYTDDVTQDIPAP